jgi:hypothetical protein
VNPALPPKEITCTCGNTFVSQQRSNWCRSCGKQLFYDPKDEKRSRSNRIFIAAIMVMVVGLLGYFFIEMIITPILSLRQ